MRKVKACLYQLAVDWGGGGMGVEPISAPAKCVSSFLVLVLFCSMHCGV